MRYTTTFPLGIVEYLDNSNELLKKVKLSELIEKLGKTAGRLWALLVGVRSGTGITHPTRAWMAKKLGVSLATIKQSLTKLKKAGLVLPLGKQVRDDVFDGVEMTTGIVWCWKVKGIVPIKTDGTYSKYVDVPVEAFEWLRTALGWGGSRRKGTTQQGTTITKQPARPSKTNRALYSEFFKYSRRYILKSIFPSSNRGRKYVRSQIISSQLPLPNNYNSDTGTVMSKQAEQFSDTIKGKSIKLEGYWPWLESQGWIPRYPCFATVTPAVVPTPPRLKASMSEREQVLMLAAAYRAVTAKVTRKKSWVFTRGEIKNSKWYPLMARCVSVLLEHDISPTSWIWWSSRIWREYGDNKSRKGKTPPMKWMFDPDRVVKRRGWFRVDGDTLGGKVVLTDAHRQLMSRYMKMKRDLMSLRNDINRTAVEAVVERYFPNGLYEFLVQKARVDAQDLQCRLEMKVSGGKWVW